MEEVGVQQRIHNSQPGTQLVIGEMGSVPGIDKHGTQIAHQVIHAEPAPHHQMRLPDSPDIVLEKDSPTMSSISVPSSIPEGVVGDQHMKMENGDHPPRQGDDGHRMQLG